MKVVIVGAGISGLAAARELQFRGHQVIVLEAHDRIGGRAWTRPIGSVAIDTGAAFIHGVGGNPLSEIAQMAQIKLTRMNQCVLYDSKGSKIRPELDKRIETLFNQVLTEATRRRRQSNHSTVRLRNQDISLGAAMDQVLDPDTLTAEEREIYEWHRLNLSFANAADLYSISNAHWDQDDEFAMSGDHCLLDTGYQDWLQALAQGVDIRLNQQVNAIRYTSRRVSIGTTKGNWLTADVVLVTLSLGVLKTHSIRFDPPLPKAKLSAIQSLGFGVINKVILRFRKVFWSKKEFIGYTGSSGGFFLFVNGALASGKPILITIVTGEFAQEIETMTKAQVVKKMMMTLRKIYPRATSPVESIVTHWQSDPFTRGAYSYIPTGASGDDYDAMAAPICRPVDGGSVRVSFAGEGTIKNYPATAHGAFFSGIREARRIDGEVDFDCRPMPYSFRVDQAPSVVKKASKKRQRPYHKDFIKRRAAKG